MNLHDIIELLDDYLNQKGLFQDFLDFAENEGYNREDLENDIDRALS